MRILFLSDFYPPIKAGGYAQLCEEVAQQLKFRGHEVWTLTSNYQHHLASLDETSVFRLLHLEGAIDYYHPLDFLLHWKRRFRTNLAILNNIVAKINPEVLLIWNLRMLSKALAATAERWNHPPTAYYLAGYWPVLENIHKVYWRTPAQHGHLRFLKRLFSAIALRQLNELGSHEPCFKHVMCVSQGLKNALIDKGLPVEGAQIVYNGIDPNQFSFTEKDHSISSSRSPFKLVYAGQIVPQKGVHTVVEALDLLLHHRASKNIHLTILGSGHPTYVSYLRNLIIDRGLEDYIELLPPLPREKMPAFLQQFDSMVLPSIYEEPLARSIQEAMACGLIVIATLTGGSREIIVDGENGLSFTPGDASSLASQLERIMSDLDLRRQLARMGRKTVVERFGIWRMVDELENFLYHLTMYTDSHPDLVVNS